MSKENNLNEKMAQLDALLAWFDSDDFELEQALEKFTEAQTLAGSIEEDLSALKNNITVVSEQFDREAE